MYTHIHTYVQVHIIIYLYIPENAEKGTSRGTGCEKRSIDTRIYVYRHTYICTRTYHCIYTYLKMRKKEHQVVQDMKKDV